MSSKRTYESNNRKRKAKGTMVNERPINITNLQYVYSILNISLIDDFTNDKARKKNYYIK